MPNSVFSTTETFWQSQPPLTAFVFSQKYFSPNISFILSLYLSLHRISPVYSQWKMTEKNSNLLPQPRLAGAPSPGCLLLFCVPVTAPSYLALCQCHLPFPHLSHPALVPSLFVSHSKVVSFLTIKSRIPLHVLNPYLTSFAPPIAPFSPFHL